MRNKAFKANLLGNYTIQRNTNDTYTKYDIGYSIHEENFINLLENPEFEDHLTRLYAINSWTNVQSDILRNRIVNIINMLTNEIKNIPGEVWGVLQ